MFRGAECSGETARTTADDDDIEVQCVIHAKRPML
jgi:hypothetical protein